MKEEKDILMVCPPVGKFVPEEENRYVLRLFFENCINVGVLSILTYLEKHNYSTSLLDLFSLSDWRSIKEKLKNCLQENHFKYVGISCISAFSYLESIKIAEIIKEVDDKIIVIVGGQHVGALRELPLIECKHFDVNVFYEGELPLKMILDDCKLSEIKGVVYRNKKKIIVNEGKIPGIKLDDMAPMNFSLYPSYRKYSPFIEESRGCPCFCNFCTASYVYGGCYRVKRHDLFKRDLDSLISYYPDLDYLNVLSSTFGMNISNACKITEYLGETSCAWGTEVRADFNFNKNGILERMSDSGLSVLSVGVESLSDEILIKMNKTKNPRRYIDNFIKMVEKCSQIGSFKLKVNVVMYLGETPKTFSETLKVLFQYKEAFSKIRFFTVLSPPGSEVFRNLKSASPIRNDFWDKIHIYPLNLSEYYPAEKSVLLCEEMNKLFS